MNINDLQEVVEGALNHIYDYPFLASHSLAFALRLPEQTLNSGRVLCQYLIETIDALKPTEDIPRDSSPWRCYWYLQLRYIRLNSVRQVSHSLGLSERQTRRVHPKALELLTSAIDAKIRASGLVEVDRSGTAARDVASEVEGRTATSAEARRLASAGTRLSVDLSELIAGVLDVLSGIIDSHAVAVTYDLPAEILPVLGDRTLLRQSLISLIVAAINCGAEKILLSANPKLDTLEIDILLASERSSHAGRYEFRNSIPALMEDESMRAAVGLLNAQSARVDVDGIPDGSILVRLIFPSFRKKTILIVDDNPDTITLFRHYLASGPYSVIEAHNGKDALKLAREELPDAIILDIMMPDQDGWETLQSLRMHPNTRDTIVIICSVIEQRELAKSLGASDLLPKPVTRHQFLQILESHLAS